MFAVGGGPIPVLPTFDVPEFSCFGVILRSESPTGFAIGVGVPPYFFSNSCVLLYFVAVLSFSMVVSLCFCNSSS